MSTTDPFTQVYQAIYAALVASSAWSALVQPGNRIDVSQVNGVRRQATQNSRVNLPEFDLRNTGFKDEPRNSLADRRTQSFRAFVATPVDKTVLPLNQIKDATINAIKAVGPNLGLSFVYDTRFKDCAETFTKRETDRPGGRAGFNAIVNIFVEMWIPKT